MDAAHQPVFDKTVVQSEKALVEQWLVRLDVALQSENRASVASLFAPEGHWRDLLAFTWSITPCQGAADIATLMVTKQATARAHGFAIAAGRTPPRRVQRAGNDVIEGIFQFETEVGRGFGVVRLLAAEPSTAIQLMTGLHELKGFEEKIGKRRPTTAMYSRTFGGPGSQVQRTARQAYTERDPVVLVAGGGQAGLSIAATLGRLGVDTLVIDRHERVGDCWRKRYDSLVLHNDTAINHLPYMPFPPSWPTYLSKDRLADWFEAYAWAMEINFRTGAELTSAAYDASAGRWQAVVRNADGSASTVRPRHLIFANGLLGFPRIPELPGLKDFKGVVMHTSEFTNGADWRGKKALIVGTGTSGHDVAQDLHAHGCEATIVERGSSTVVSIDPSLKLIYGIYQDIPVEDGDLLVSTNTFPMVKKNLQLLTARMVELDKKMIAGLVARGFKWDMGDEVAKTVGPVWGIGPDGEMNNMWKRTAQEGLWFVGGSFANCRTYSRYLALQIKAIEEGIAPKQ